RSYLHSRFLFFFQAEDGIRDYKVTGVQTCALPISEEDLEHADYLEVRRLWVLSLPRTPFFRRPVSFDKPGGEPLTNAHTRRSVRSEERRVGKECRGRGSA